MILAPQEGDTLTSVDRDGYLSLIEAARQAGVGHFIYTSFSALIQDTAKCPLTDAKITVEQALLKSGMAYTILRPSYFTESWLSPHLMLDIAGGTATIPGSGTNKVSWISALDVAQFAAASVDSAAAKNAILELGGPDALSPLEVVKMCEEMSGKKITVTHEPVEELEKIRSSADNGILQSIMALKLALEHSSAIDMTQVQARFPSIKLATVKDYIKSQL
jgi:NADH dehydrogenase